MFIFFVNKPMALIPYFFGLAILFYLGLFDRSYLFPGSFFMNSFCFSLWYYMVMVRYYILNGEEELVVWEVKINQFKHFFDFILVVDAIAMIAALIISWEMENGFLPSFLLVFFTSLSFIILQKIVFAKFISQGLKYNSSLKDMNFDTIYKEIREVAIKKIIQSNNK